VAYNDLTNMFGIGLRAGKFLLGTCACEKAIKQKKLKILFLDKGSAEKTVKRFEKQCLEGKTKIIMIEKGDFVKITNMDYKIIGVSDKKFAVALIDKFKCVPYGGIVND
jgi:ribosomal protein L7Ae-like RNA K-turn-binding protein